MALFQFTCWWLVSKAERDPDGTLVAPTIEAGVAETNAVPALLEARRSRTVRTCGAPMTWLSETKERPE